MRRLIWLGLLAAVAGLRAANLPLETEVTGLIAGPQVTVVHFWAPWCPNCRAEMSPTDGWAHFIAANPAVKFVFIDIWHKDGNPQERLTAAGLGAQPNLILRVHPNPSRLAADRLNSFLGLPITWIPTTWVYREGRLRAAFNYGEIRFPILQQMIDDASQAWEH